MNMGLSTSETEDIFKCRSCGEKYDHNKMASDKDVSLCKWCAGEMEEDNEK